MGAGMWESNLRRSRKEMRRDPGGRQLWLLWPLELSHNRQWLGPVSHLVDLLLTKGTEGKGTYNVLPPPQKVLMFIFPTWGLLAFGGQS